MATYLPIRPLNRSASVRIDSQDVTDATKTYYVDVTKAQVRKDLATHASFGQYLVVGVLTSSNIDPVVASGVTVVAGTAANSIRLADPLTPAKTSGVAGELRDRTTGAIVSVPVTDSVALTANALGFTRTDLVVVDNVTGVATIVLGTAVGVAPATPAGKTAVATFTVANATTTLGPITDVRARP